MRAYAEPPYGNVFAQALVMQQYDQLYQPYTPPLAYVARGTAANLGPWGVLGSEYSLVEKLNVPRGALEMNAVVYPQLEVGPGLDFRRDVPRLEVPYYMAVRVLVVCTWTAVAFVLVLAIMVVPGLALTVPAPLAALTLGCLGGLVVTRHQRSTTRQVTVAGLCVGVGALLANVVAFGLIGYVLGSLSAIQDMLRTTLPVAQAQAGTGSIASFGAVAGGLAGFVSGLVDLILAVVGALVGGLLADHPPAQKRARRADWSAAQPLPGLGRGTGAPRGTLAVTPRGRRAHAWPGSRLPARPGARPGAAPGRGA
jgi:hypothetical protein